MVYGKGEEFNAATSDADGGRGEGSRPPLVQFSMSPDIFLDGVIWLSLEELGQQVDSNPLLALLALPVQPETELVWPGLNRSWRADQISSLPFKLSFWSGFPYSLALLHEEIILEIATIPAKDLLRTRVAQDLLDQGREEGREEGEALSVVLPT
jgi:hypothetical protein